jgi:pimeloyl-ACP methyl ester carboxylesterase
MNNRLGDQTGTHVVRAIDPQVSIDGLEQGSAAGVSFLRRRAAGAGRPLLLLHGIGSNARSFAALMAALPNSLDAVAWNAPGYANSVELRDPSPTPRSYADALARVLDALGLDRVVLLGHSLGALFAASFAANHAPRVAALALVSPALGYGLRPGEALPAAVQARIDDIRELGPERFAASRAARLVGDPEARPDVVAAVREAMASVRLDGYGQAVRALGAGDLCADAARIQVPAIVVVGSADRITPPASAWTAHAAFKSGNAAWLEFSGGGHALPQEQPAAVARLVTDLLER